MLPCHDERKPLYAGTFLTAPCSRIRPHHHHTRTTRLAFSRYCLVALGASENFYSVFEQELADTIPVIHCTINGTRIIGRMVVGELPGSW